MNAEQITTVIEELREVARTPAQEFVLDWLALHTEEIEEASAGKEIEMELTARRAIEIIEDNLDHDERLHADYSGRGMYGRTCLSVYCPHDRVNFWQHKIGPAATDAMGRDVVVYWRNLSLDDDEEEGSGDGDVEQQSE